MSISRKKTTLYEKNKSYNSYLVSSIYEDILTYTTNIYNDRQKYEKYIAYKYDYILINYYNILFLRDADTPINPTSKYKSIVKYKHDLHDTFNINEIFIKFNINIRKNEEILSIGHNLALLKYMTKSINTSYKTLVIPTRVSFKTIGVSKHSHNKDNTIQYINEIADLYKLNVIYFNDIIYNLYNFLGKSKKYMLLYYDIIEIATNIGTRETSYNFINIYIGLICALSLLDKKGTAILNIYSATTQFNADVVLICKKYFNTVNLYKPEIYPLHKRSGVFLICQDFNGISDTKLKEYEATITTMKNRFPNGTADIDIDVLEDSSILGYKLPADIKNYDYIINFNNEMHYRQYSHLSDLIKFTESNPGTELHIPTPQQIINAIIYCKKWNIEYFKYYDETTLKKNKIMKDILSEMYGFLEPLMFLYKTPATFKAVPSPKSIKYKTTARVSQSSRKLSLSIQRKQASADSFLKQFNITRTMEESTESTHFREIITDLNWKIMQTEYMIESRRDYTIKDKKMQLPDYFWANSVFRYFKHKGRGMQNSIEDVIYDKLRIRVSQAWCKMLEMLMNVNIIKRGNGGEYKTFHLCEAPGNFISCINYYIHAYTNYTKLAWNAQSLDIKIADIGDEFGFIKKYPQRWHWGADGSGDITKIDNILYYRQFCENIDLITSDCGVSMETKNYEQIVLASMIAILYLLPRGANAVYKIMMPIGGPNTSMLIWDVIYLYYINFKKLYFFKPVQNNQSREIYIIGIGYQRPQEELIQSLLKYISDYDNIKDHDNTRFIKGDYDAAFVYQTTKFLESLIDNWCFTIQRQLFYSDNIDTLDKSFIELAKRYVEEKNHDWLAKYNLKKIDKKFFL